MVNEFFYSRDDPNDDLRSPSTQMVNEHKTTEDEQQLYKMLTNINRCDMRNVSAAIALADDMTNWDASKIEKYIPREWLERNEAGEIIIYPKQGDS
jgi:hypothetical protein